MGVAYGEEDKGGEAKKYASDKEIIASLKG